MRRLSIDDEEIKSLAHGYLSMSRLRATSTRLALVQLLMDETSPLSLKEITAKCKGYSLASIYRMLELFIKKNLVQVINMGTKEIQYEFLPGRKHHHHVICINCGELEDIENCALRGTEDGILKKTEKFASLSHHSLEFFGVCMKCSPV